MEHSRWEGAGMISPILYPAEAMGHVPVAPCFDPVERRIVLTLSRMMWRDARDRGHMRRMASIRRLGATIRMTKLGDRFVQ